MRHHADGWRVVNRYVVPLATAATLGLIVLTSAVPPNLLIVTHGWAELTYLAYAVTLIYSAMRPASLRPHQIGVALAVVCVGGRAGGFIELALERGTTSLIGAVAERALTALLLVVWHIARSRSIGRTGG